jgi:nucleoside-diphosphate-sugar epimerase
MFMVGRQATNDYSGVITRFISAVKDSESHDSFGDGMLSRDFVKVAHVVQAILSSISIKAPEYQIFNIGSGVPTTINELAKAVSQVAGVELKACYKPRRSGDVRYSYADISRAKKHLNYSPKIQLYQGLKTLYNA